MCIIIAKNKGVEPLDMGYFERAWDHNGDGGGIVWKSPENEDAHVQKGFMKKEDMIAKLKEINTKDNSFIAHFRIKSVGEVKPENTHPFVMDKVTFAHNGTITSLKPLEGKTDSETFGLAFLKNRSMKWIKENQLLLELALGSSKFAIMDNKTGEILILNKENGKEQDGAWFSNSSADKPTPLPQTTTYSYNRGGYLYDFDDVAGRFKVKARSFFGTKSYTESLAEYSKDKGYWVYPSSERPTSTYPFSNDVVVSRNGLWKINPEIKVEDFMFDSHKYKHRDVAYKIVQQMQRLLQRNLASYWKMTFDCNDDREEIEQDLSALNIVLDACRRFIRAGCELNLDNLYVFVTGSMTTSSYCGTWKKEVANYVIDCAIQHIGDFFTE